MPLHLLIRRGKIQSHCRVLTARGQGLAIRTNGYGLNTNAKASEGGELPLGDNIPQPDALITTGGGKQLAIGTKSDGPTSIEMTGEGTEFMLGGDIPELNRLIATPSQPCGMSE